MLFARDRHIHNIKAQIVEIKMMGKDVVEYYPKDAFGLDKIGCYYPIT